MKELVTVKSKTINNEAVPVVFNTSEVMQGDAMDVREISRTVVFRNFQAEAPLYLAKLLVKMNPKEYTIVGEDQTVETVTEKQTEFKCEYCGATAKSKAGLVSHVRYVHPDKWVKKS